MKTEIPTFLTPCTSSLIEVSDFIAKTPGFIVDNELTTLNVDYPEAYKDYYLMRTPRAENERNSYRIGFAFGFFIGRKHSDHTDQKLLITQDTIMQSLLELDANKYDMRNQVEAINERMVNKENRFGILALADEYRETVENMLFEMGESVDKEIYDKAFAEALMLVMISLETENLRKQYFPTVWERIKNKLSS